MQINFGLTFDQDTFPLRAENSLHVFNVGIEKLLTLLEDQLGIPYLLGDQEHIRIEQYRQALLLQQKQDNSVFYGHSLDVSPFATAVELLAKRDELLLAGWDFNDAGNPPQKLKTFSQVETIFLNNPSPAIGLADRYDRVINLLKNRTLNVRLFAHLEPYELLPPAIHRLIKIFTKKDINCTPFDIPVNKAKGDLGVLQQAILENDFSPIKAKADGSLLLIRAKRETTLAEWTAKWMAENPDFHPYFIIPDKSGIIDNAFIQEALPGLGIQSISIARPALQILKLIPVFLWNPIDPFKILEFLSLALKPLDDNLARKVALFLAQKPGINSDSWRLMIKQFFDELQDNKEPKHQEIQQQYHFWFGRKRYPVQQMIPKREPIEIYRYLSTWATQAFDENGSNNTSLIVLKEQAKRIYELLESLPEEELSYLQLENIVRTIYQPAPVEIQGKQVAHFPFVSNAGSIAEPVDSLVWWNFSALEQEHFFANWYKDELNWLQNKNIRLQSPQDKNNLVVWQRKRPFLLTQKQIILLLPSTCEGQEVAPHPSYGYLEAKFNNIENLLFDIQVPEDLKRLSPYFSTPQKETLKPKYLPRPQAFIELKKEALFKEQEHESFTSLDALFYYPHKWVFKYRAQLRKPSILSVVKERTLMGNLSHRFFEKLLRKDIYNLNKEQIFQSVDENIYALLAQEGSILLLYGKEPERIDFINKLKFAAWSLISLIRNNGWKVEQTEKLIEGHFAHKPIKGRADLVLSRGNERAIVDLKWSKSIYKEREIKNFEDLQLTLYTYMSQKEGLPHPTAAYFIINEGKMIARTKDAFKEVTPVLPDANFETINNNILAKMDKTYLWRIHQLTQNKVEIRCEATVQQLEEIYGSELLDLLEMKTADAYFDDYRSLIGLVE